MSFNVLDVGELCSETSVMKGNGFYRNGSDVHVPADHWHKVRYLKLNRHLSRKYLSTTRYQWRLPESNYAFKTPGTPSICREHHVLWPAFPSSAVSDVSFNDMKL
jgi:hypothetical protein